MKLKERMHSYLPLLRSGDNAKSSEFQSKPYKAVASRISEFTTDRKSIFCQACNKEVSCCYVLFLRSNVLTLFQSYDFLLLDECIRPNIKVSKYQTDDINLKLSE